MAKPDFTRTLRWMREGTERRRRERSRRTRTYALMVAVGIALLVLALPSLASYSPLVHSILRSTAAEYGWEASARSIRIGWVSPLRIQGLEAVGASGKTLVAIESIDAPMTLMDLISGRADWGTINVDAPRLETHVYPGGSLLEDDLAAFLQAEPEDPAPTATIVLRDATIKVIDDESAKAWRADQLQSTIAISPRLVDVTLDGVITDPDGISGALQTHVSLPQTDVDPLAFDGQTEGIPLSLMELIAQRVPRTAAALPEQWSGNASGKFNGQVLADGNFQLHLSPMDLRNLVVHDPRLTGQSPWKVGRAVIRGGLGTEGDILHADQWTLESDAGNASLHGAVQMRAVEEGHLLDALVGDFTTDFDLAALATSTPGLIPIRSDVTVERGRVQARVSGAYGQDQLYRSTWQLKTEPIRAAVAGANSVVLDPITADVTLRPTGNWITAEHLQVRSSFGEATASGDFRGGEAQFHLNFGRLASMLRSILEMPDTRLEGIASGNVRWSVRPDNAWMLDGTANARDVAIGLAGAETIAQSSVDVAIEARGAWGTGELERLEVAQVRLSQPGQSWTFTLAEAVHRPDAQTLLPLRIRGSGRLESLASALGPWLPDSVEAMEGAVEAEVKARASLRAGHLSEANLTLKDASLVMAGRRYDQSSIKMQFAGDLAWPEMNLQAKTLSVSGNAVSLAVQGDLLDDYADLELAYRADLSRLQGSITRRGNNPRAGEPVDSAWRVTGMVEGRAEVRRNAAGPYMVVFETNSKDLQALQPPAVANVAGTVGPIAPTAANLQPTVVWFEPQVAFGGDLRIQPGGAIAVDHLHVTAPWVTGEFTGAITQSNGSPVIRLSGPAAINTQTAGQRVSGLLGEPIQMTGLHQTDLDIRWSGMPEDREQLEITGSIGWKSARVAGVNLGATAVPLRVTENVVHVDPATIPLDRGQVHVAGEVHYRPGVLWFEQRPGRFAEGIELTPEICRSWLKYMMPLAADATEVRGSFSVDLNECLVIPSDPARSRVVGTLQVDSAAVGPGPLAQTLTASIDQVERALKGLRGQSSNPQPAKQWIQMEPQAVDFAMLGGQVTHQRVMMNVGKVNLISSGEVGLDGALNLRVQLPLETSWLGGDLAALSGRQITLPVTGTLGRPQVDTQQIAGTIGQLGVQAVQSTAENYLQRQLDRQLQKLIGK